MGFWFGFLVASLCFACFMVGWYGRVWWLKRQPQDERPRGPRRCSICQVELPKGTVRTSEGFWRCAKHKGGMAA